MHQARTPDILPYNRHPSRTFPCRRTLPLYCARLWQDPLQVANEAEARRKKEAPPPLPPGIKQLQEKYGVLERPLVLLMCVPDSPYAEHVERRLRDRAAMHYALSAEGYVPKQSATLDYYVTGGGHAVPFESFVLLDKGKPAEGKTIFAIWVGDSVLEDKPLQGFARIIENLRPEGCSLIEPPEVRILGPSNSDQYRKILEELKELETPPGAITKRLLSKTQVYSCKATAAEEKLLEGVGCPYTGDSAHMIQLLLQNDHFCKDFGSCFTFERAVVTDDQLCKTLVEELQQRHITLDGNTSIAVLSEMESFYGRVLVETFRTSVTTAAEQREKDLYGKDWAKKRKPETPNEPHIYAYTYMAGIDGALPKNALGVEARTDKDKGSNKEGTISLQEPTEGQSQIDYFRRLADMLVKKDKEDIRKGGRGIQVVALLGSDIYDKLQILRTLRHELPNALFITNDLDARYGHPDEWEETRNLLVAASSPLEVDWLENKLAETPPPFRDNTQVAVYAATRHALNPQSDNYPYKDWKGRSRLFEIGKRGPVELNTVTKVAKRKAEEKEKKVTEGQGGRFRPIIWEIWSFVRRFGSIVLKIVFIALPAIILAWLLQVTKSKGAMPHKVRSAARDTLRELWDMCCRSLYMYSRQSVIAIPAAIIVSAIITAFRFSTQHEASAEPFAFYEGISIWPGDFVRLFVLLLAIHFVCKTLADLQENLKKLTGDFCLDQPPSVPDPWREVIRIWWKYDWPHANPSSSTEDVNAQKLVNKFRVWGTEPGRCVRAGILLVIYVGLILGIMGTIGGSVPLLPVRGTAFSWSGYILCGAVILTLYATFLVVDATRLNCLFIRELNRSRSVWPLPDRSNETKFKFFRSLDVLDDEDCNDYLDIQYIARRSDTVNKLIYFPFILIALLIAARWSQTDGYPWPTMLIVIFVLNAAWAAYCAILLPLEARKARDSSLKRLREKLFTQRVREAINPDATKDPLSNSVALAAVIAEIEQLREGAFVGIWEQPLLRAIVLPSGGVGLWAFVDFLQR